MSRVQFETTNIPGAMFGFQWAALRLIEELAQHHPDQGYIESLREKVLSEIKNSDFTGLSMDLEKPHLDASIGAVNFVFDHIGWR